MKKRVRFYNLVFPIFLIKVFHPLFILCVLSCDFLIDSIILLAISFVLFKRVSKDFYKKYIIKVWSFGLVADLIGVCHLTIWGEVAERKNIVYETNIFEVIYKSISKGYEGNCFYNLYSVLYILSGVIIAGLAIFFFNYCCVFKTSMTKKQRIFLCLMIAVTTAPYTFFWEY